MVCSKLRKTAFTSAPLRLLVVLALLLTQAPLLPAMILGAATLDGGHRIECGSDVHGMKLRLAHYRTDSAPTYDAGLPERHSCLLRLFVRESPGGSDHQFSFSSPSDAVSDSGSTAPEDQSIGIVPPPELAPRFPVALTPQLSDRNFAIHHTGPPALDRLRAVVMRA